MMSEKLPTSKPGRDAMASYAAGVETSRKGAEGSRFGSVLMPPAHSQALKPVSAARALACC